MNGCIILHLGLGAHCEISQTRGKKNEFMTRITVRRQFSSNQSWVTQNASLITFFCEKGYCPFLNLPKSTLLNRATIYLRNTILWLLHAQQDKWMDLTSWCSYMCHECKRDVQILWLTFCKTPRQRKAKNQFLLPSCLIHNFF